MKKIEVSIAVLLFLVTFISFGKNTAQAMCNGPLCNATKSSAVKVCKISDLNNVRNDLGGSYIQICNIDLAGVNFEPIGTLTQSFAGVYDGNGYTISNFSYTSPSGYLSAGLFASSMGEIKNVRLENVNVMGNITVGALVGTNTGVIDNSHVVSGVVDASGSGARHVGGLVGFNGDFNGVHEDMEGQISNSSSAATVGSMSATYTGGLVGVSDYGFLISNSHATGDVYGRGAVGGLVGGLTGTISHSYATGNVFAEEQESHGCSPIPGTNTCLYVGGLVGHSSWQGSVNRSYATGSVRGYDLVGGLMGWAFANSTISDSYATGNIYGRTGIGGLVGGSSSARINNNYPSPIFTNTYATGVSTAWAGTYAGGLLGYDKLAYGVPSVAVASYWDTETSATLNSALGTGKTTSQMYEQNTFSGWNFTNIWNISNGVGYPFLR